MTETYDQYGGQTSPVSEHGQAFLDALTPHARANFMPTATAGTALRKALSNGWTVPALAKECSRDLGTATNAGAIITRRLQNCANNRPPTTGFAKFVQPKPWCGNCSDDATRWLTDTDIAVRCSCWTDPKGNN